MMLRSVFRVYGPILYSLFLGYLWEGFAHSVPDPGALVLRVQVFDHSDRSLLSQAEVCIWGNHSSLASSTTGEDGVVMVTFPYRPGTWLIISAARRGFVTNSAPWRASRIPLYASVSLQLFPERAATLTVYEDMLQVRLGAPGGRRQAWVQLQWTALPASLNSSRPELSASLTAPHTQSQLGGFPYPIGLDLSHTGSNGSWVELTAVAAVSVHLYMENGSRVQVREPVHISVPLPTDSSLNTATSAPLWRLQDTTGLWLRSGSAYIRKDGDGMTWSFLAPQLGYWLAAFPSTTGVPVKQAGLGDVSSYHTIFLLSILGSMALLALLLLCLLLYYCRRRCLKPRRPHRKSAVGGRRDQRTSISRPRRHRDNHTASSDDSQVYSAHPCASNPPSSLLSKARPQTGQEDTGRPPDYSAPALTSSSTQPGQLIFCHSLEQMRQSMYSSLVPTLVIPAHYMSLTPDLPGLASLGATEQLQQEGKRTLVSPRTASAPRDLSQASDSEGHGAAPLHIPVLFNNSAMAQMSEELQTLAEDQLLELEAKLPHPQAWFVPLNGQSCSPVRHSYIDHQAAGSRARPGTAATGSEKKKADTGRIHSYPPCITLAEPGGKQAQESSSLNPDPENRRGTFPRPGRCRENTTSTSTSTSSHEDRDEDGGNKKSLWQKREERPLIVFK